MHLVLGHVVHIIRLAELQGIVHIPPGEVLHQSLLGNVVHVIPEEVLYTSLLGEYSTYHS